MIACLIGTVLAVEYKTISIEDRVTKEVFQVEADGDELLNISVGEQGVFVGKLYDNKLRVKRVEIRKFLDPLYEKDLFDVGSKYPLVSVIEDPFTSNYINFMERRKEQELEAQEEIVMLEECEHDEH